jgi:hypothetical protein
MEYRNNVSPFLAEAIIAVKELSVLSETDMQAVTRRDKVQ